MDLTLSIDERLVEEAQKIASAMGKSLNQLIRDYLEQLTSKAKPEETIAELRQLSEESRGSSRGRKFHREEAHEQP